jgi:hypothetical protein
MKAFGSIHNVFLEPTDKEVIVKGKLSNIYDYIIGPQGKWTAHICCNQP